MDALRSKCDLKVLLDGGGPLTAVPRVSSRRAEVSGRVAYTCPHCDNKMWISRRYIGQTGFCNSCKARITLAWAPAQPIDVVRAYRAGVQAIWTEPAEAERLLTEAAELKHAGAEFALGYLYANGTRAVTAALKRQGVVRNFDKAFAWFHKAADRWHVDAQAALGMMYLLGKGVRKDPVRGFVWSALAAKRHQLVARAICEHLMATVAKHELEAAQLLVGRWHEAHDRSGPLSDAPVPMAKVVVTGAPPTPDADPETPSPTRKWLVRRERPATASDAGAATHTADLH
jgi:hypothetical protein